MRNATLVLALSLAVTAIAYAGPGSDPACPVESPREGGAAITTVVGCFNGEQCPHGTPIQFRLVPLMWSGFPPGQYYEGYTVQACDVVTWDFGDGTPPVSYTGIPTATHTWAERGNYMIRATVTNSRGVSSFLAFRAVGPPVEIRLADGTAAESAGFAPRTFTRVGDTAGRVSAIFRTQAYPYSSSPVVRNGEYNIVFEPGETVKTVQIPLYDNQLYDGPTTASQTLGPATGGAIVRIGQLFLTDDDPRPTIYVDDLALREGSGGLTRATLNVRMTGPLGTYLNLFGWLSEGTAEAGSDYLQNWGGTGQLKSGETTGTISFDVIGDRIPEDDEELLVNLGRYFLTNQPLNGPPARVTILNDDATMTPRVHSGNVGERVILTVYPGERFNVPLTVPVRTTNSAALRVPQTITIPAGALSYEFPVALIGEGEGLVELRIGANEFASRITVHQPRALVASQPSLLLPPGGTRTFTLSLSPPSDAPAVVTLSADVGVVSVPETVTIPAGGEATVEVRGVARGATTIAATPVDRDVSATAVDVEVMTTRRRSAR